MHGTTGVSIDAPKFADVQVDNTGAVIKGKLSTITLMRAVAHSNSIAK